MGLFDYAQDEPRQKGGYFRRAAPEVYGALGGLLGTAPDQFEGSVLDPATARVRSGAEAGFPVGTALQALPLIGGLLGRASSMPKQTGKGQKGAITWHGSPHKFDKFDSSKIGTGEGAQAYGHGLYLAESPGVATSYIPTNEAGKVAIAKRLATETKRAARYSNEGGQEVLEMFNKGYTPQAIRSNIDNIISSENVHPAYAKRMNQAYEKGMQIYRENSGGYLYKVDLPDEAIAKMLDWDKPVPESQRVPISKAAMQRFGSGSTGTSGEHLYREVVKEFERAGHAAPKDAATAWLREQGIPGIRYLDGGSRGAGTGTSNFVVFPGNEGLLTILERNGVKP